MTSLFFTFSGERKVQLYIFHEVKYASCIDNFCLPFSRGEEEDDDNGENRRKKVSVFAKLLSLSFVVSEKAIYCIYMALL